MSETEPIRLAIVAVAPAPYRDRLFERLAKSPDIHLQVFFLHGKDSLRGWTQAELGYPAEFVPCWTPEPAYGLPFLGAVNPSLARRLEPFAPDAMVIYGHSYAAQLSAARWAAKRRIPYFLRCDSSPLNLQHGRNGGSARWLSLKKRVVQSVAEPSAGALPIGSANAEYWRLQGVTDERLFPAAFAVDNGRFSTLSGQADRAKQRSRLRVTAERMLLYLGRFVPAKNLDALIEAWKLAAPANAQLVLAGGGPLEAQLKQRAEDDRTILFHDFVPNDKTPEVYAAADALILPSLFEPWGLVVNEAMACGLPVLVSSRCGCAEDLVEHGRNGLIVEPSDPQALAESILRFASWTEDELRTMGRDSRERIAPWNYDQAIQGFRTALRSAVGR